jgi:hypothetical protein
VPSANTLVRWVNENAFASIVQARPRPTFGRPVHRRRAPIDYGPVLLLMPFGFHLAMDTLPSAVPTSLCGQRVVTPPFGYGSPHLGARGTSTLLNNALLSAHYATVRLLQHVHVRRAACGLRGPALIARPRRAGDLPVLVHVVPQRARVLRLRRTGSPLAINVATVLPSSDSEWSRHPDLRAFRSSIAPPTDASVYASRNTSRCPLQDSRSGWIRYFLSCRALASPTTCRFSPALSE